MNRLLFACFLFILSCSHRHGHNHANQHMHEKSHQILIAGFEDPKRDLWQKPKIVLNLMGGLRGKRILDLGVGSGYFSNHFLNAGAKVIGADVDDKFLQHVKERFSSNKDFSTHKLEFNDPKLTAAHYDVIFTSNTYHHIDNRVDYLKKLKSGLNPKGILVIVDFKANYLSLDFGPPVNMRVAFDTVINELQLAGFFIQSSSQEDLPHQYLIIAKNN
jgi:2-polyprenyl-3-methyl-5-hydroxy-6-metoxy-1,4-benzoquinol methylase